MEDETKDECSTDEIKEEPCDAGEYEEYKAVMLETKKKYAVTMVGSDCAVMEKYFNPISKHSDVRFLSFTAFKNKMLNKKVLNPWRAPGQKKYQSVGNMYLSSAFRKDYKQVLFDPSQTVNENQYYNLFRGFGVKPKQGDWSFLKNHILEILCDGDVAINNYFLSWMARIIQDPGGTRPGTAIVCKGVQGCGKGTVFNAFGKVVGSHFRHILNIQHLTGKFNTHLRDALFVFCDEITWGGDNQSAGILKGMVTEPTVPIEQKGKDMTEFVSHINLAIASNNDWIIPAGLEERRFCVLNVKSNKAGKRDYFNNIYEQLYNGGYEAMLYDLLNYDYSGVDLRTIPRTKALFEQMLNSMSPVHKFWFQRLEDGTLLLNQSHWEQTVSSYQLYNSYQDFCNSIGKTYKLMLNQFSRKLKELCPSMLRIRPRINGEQTQCFAFPGLKKCREEFVNAISMQIEWDDPETEKEDQDQEQKQEQMEIDPRDDPKW